MSAGDFDESKAHESLKFIKKLNTLWLDTYRVVGNYVRHDPDVKDRLIKIKDMIISGLKTGASQENYLIGGLPGSGKSTFIKRLGHSISDFANFEELKLSEEDEKNFRTKLAHLKDIQGPLLCLIDEVDSKLSEEWPFVALLDPLEKQEKPYRPFSTCFVLVGSGSCVEELRNRIASGKKGPDILRRVQFKGEYYIPPMSLADRILVALCHLTEEARKSNSQVSRVQKLALLYIALKRDLENPSKISDLAVSCIRRRRGETRDTVYYDDLFDSGDEERGQFESRWKDKCPKGFIYVKDYQVRGPESRDIKFDQIFEPVEIAFEREIKDNFLRDLDYSRQPDYIKLLSPDFRRLFNSFFKEYYTILVTGREGVGKTFNCLLFGKMLAAKGHKVYYSSVRNINLLANSFLGAADLAYGKYVFIIDDCQEGLNSNKTSEIVKSIRRLNFRTIDRPKFIFLSHPMNEVETIDVFGGDIRILEFKEKYADLRYLAQLFFRNIDMYDKLAEFFDWLDQSDISKAFSRYKNMRFWNIYFGIVKLFRRIRIDEAEFLNLAYQFFKRTKRQLIELKDPLAKLLPFFANGSFVLKEYVEKQLQVGADLIVELEHKGITDRTSVPWEDAKWDNCTLAAFRSKIHPTEAKILQAVLQKCEGMMIDDRKVLIDYAATYYESLYYIIKELCFYNFALLEDLCGDERFVSIVQKYLKERHLGKHLDRTIRNLSELTQQLRNQFVKDEIVDEWIVKLNDPKYYMNSKVSLLEAIYKVSPVAAYKCYEKLDINTLTENFRSIPSKGGRGGVPTFTRFIEVSKNIFSFYLFSINPVFENELNEGRLSDDLRRDFGIKGYPLSDGAKVEHISAGHWRIIDTENAFLVRRTGSRRPALIVHFSFDDSKRQAFSISKTKEVLQECFNAFLERFEGDKFFSQIHWLLKRLDSIKLDFTTERSLANFVLEKIPPQKIVEWIKIKDTAVHELRFVLKPSRFIFIELEGQKKNLYHDFLMHSFIYPDIKRIFENPRSSLYSICITSKHGWELLADSLYQYSQEECFANKVSAKRNQNLYLINQSVELVESNDGLSAQQKRYVINRIITVSKPDLRRCAMRTIRIAKRLGKEFDKDMEIKKFLKYYEKYAYLLSSNLGKRISFEITRV